MTTPHPPPRPPRPESREVLELKQLKDDQPELAGAVDMQIALAELQRRAQSRVPLPWLEVPSEWITERHRKGKALLQFPDIPLDWTEFRLVMRQTADILRRFDALDSADHAAIQTVLRNGRALEPIVMQWFNLTAAPELAMEQRTNHAEALASAATISAGMLDQVLALAMRPFLARAAEVLLQRPEIRQWRQSYCPLCAGEPEFAVITPSADRLLICGRCTGQWTFHPLTCPFCQNAERSLITSFASRDGRYRIYACDVCKRYLKAYDARTTKRPVSLIVDSIATLPLDAAAMQKGYHG
jgi:hypothetical protein